VVKHSLRRHVAAGRAPGAGLSRLRAEPLGDARGEVMATTNLEGEELSRNQVAQTAQLLVAGLLRQARPGIPLVEGVQFDVNLLQQLGRELSEEGGQSVKPSVACGMRTPPNRSSWSCVRVGRKAVGALSAQPRTTSEPAAAHEKRLRRSTGGASVVWSAGP